MKSTNRFDITVYHTMGMEVLQAQSRFMKLWMSTPWVRVQDAIICLTHRSRTPTDMTPLVSMLSMWRRSWSGIYVVTNDMDDRSPPLYAIPLSVKTCSCSRQQDTRASRRKCCILIERSGMPGYIFLTHPMNNLLWRALDRDMVPMDGYFFDSYELWVTFQLSCAYFAVTTASKFIWNRILYELDL